MTVVVPDVQVGEDTEPAPPDHRYRSAQIQRAVTLTRAFAQPGSGTFPSLPVFSASADAKPVPGLEEALQVHRPGVLSVFVCGGGPAVGILARGQGSEAAAEVRACFARHRVASATSEYRLSTNGARDWNAVRPEISLPTGAGLRPALA